MSRKRFGLLHSDGTLTVYTSNVGIEQARREAVYFDENQDDPVLFTKVVSLRVEDVDVIEASCCTDDFGAGCGGAATLEGHPPCRAEPVRQQSRLDIKAPCAATMATKHWQWAIAAGFVCKKRLSDEGWRPL